MLPQPKRRPTCLALGWPVDTTHKYGLNADDVLRSPHVRASHLRVAAREEINKTLAIIEQTRWRTQPHSPRARPSEKAPDRQIGRPTPNASKAGKQEAKGASRLALGRGDGKGRPGNTPKKKALQRQVGPGDGGLSGKASLTEETKVSGQNRAGRVTCAVFSPQSMQISDREPPIAVAVALSPT